MSALSVVQESGNTPERRSWVTEFVQLAFRGLWTSKIKPECTFLGPKHVQHV